MFMGIYKHNIDNKGRVIIPAKLRHELGNDFVVTKGVDKCISIYTKEGFDVFLDKLDKLPNHKAVNRQYERELFKNMNIGNMDNNGRVLIPEILREMQNIKDEVYIIGVRDRIEIWDKQTHDDYESQVASLDELSENLEFGNGV